MTIAILSLIWTVSALIYVSRNKKIISRLKLEVKYKDKYIQYLNDRLLAQSGTKEEK